MDARKLKVIEELLKWLAGSQGDEIKDMMDADKAPPPDLGDSLSSADELDPEDHPKGIKVEKVEIMGKKPGLPGEEDDDAPELKVGGTPPDPKGNEISSDDLDELYKKYRGGA